MIQWRKDDRVFVHYAAKKLPALGSHMVQDARGAVAAAAKFRSKPKGPRNVAVKLDSGAVVVVPCGNVRKEVMLTYYFKIILPKKFNNRFELHEIIPDVINEKEALDDLAKHLLEGHKTDQKECTIEMENIVEEMENQDG